MATVATLELPLNLTVATLRASGTGDSLLAALDALVNVTEAPETAEVEVEVEVADEATETEPEAEVVVSLEDATLEDEVTVAPF